MKPEEFVAEFLKMFGKKTGFRLLNFYINSRDIRENY